MIQHPTSLLLHFILLTYHHGHRTRDYALVWSISGRPETLLVVGAANPQRTGIIDFLYNFLPVDSHSNFLTSYWFLFQQGTVMQGFISSNCSLRYQPQLKSGSTYSLKNFFATKPKEIYRVSDLRVTINLFLEQLCPLPSWPHMHP